MLDWRASWVDPDTGDQRVIRNKDARERRETPVGEIKKEKKRGEEDADLFAEYVYVKGEPGWKEKKDGTNRKLLNEFRAPPRRLFSPVYTTGGVPVHAYTRVPTPR